MRYGPSQVPRVRGNLLPHSRIAASVADRAAQVAPLILKRRRIALAYRRTRSDEYRLELEQIDHALACHNIDIPAIQRLTKKL